MAIAVADAFVVDEAPEEAFGAAEQKREVAMATGDEKSRALCMAKAGAALALMGRPDEGFGYASEAMSMLSDMRADEAKTAAMDALTKVYLKRGRDAEELEEALDSGMDALKLCQKVSFRKGEAVTLLTLCSVYSALENSSSAVKYGKEALAVFAELGDSMGMAAAYKGLMEAYMAKPDAGKAVKQGYKAYGIYESASYKLKMAACMHMIAKTEVKGGDYKKASEALASAKSLFGQASDYKGEAACLETLMGLYLEAEMYVEAVKVGQERVSIFQTSGDMEAQGYAMVKLGEILLENEDHEKAAGYATSALGMFAGISNMAGLHAARNLHEATKHAASVEEIGIALAKVSDFVHIPATLVVDPGLNKRMNEQYTTSMVA